MCNIKFKFIVLYLQITSLYRLKCTNENLQEKNTEPFLDDSELDRYKLFVNSINEIKTMGNVQGFFTESDLNKILNINSFDEEDEVVVKFQTKIKCLLCTYSLIVKCMLYHLKSLSKSEISDDVMLSENSLSNDISEEVKEIKKIQLKKNNKANRVTFDPKTRCIYKGNKHEEYFEDLKVPNDLNREKKQPIKHQSIIELFTENVHKMLSVLYAGKIVAPDWLWIVSIRLNAVKVKQMTVDEFCDEKLEISIYNHSKHCADLNILEPIELVDEQYTRNLSMELLCESSDGLIDIYKYKVQFNVYKFFWRDRYDSENIPINIVPSYRHYPWYDIIYNCSYYVAALSVCIGTIGTWKNDYFVILKYFEFLKKSLLSITAYCILKHSLYYIKNRWPYHKLFRAIFKSKNILLDKFLESPRVVLSNIGRFLKMEKDNFFLDIDEHLRSTNNKTENQFKQFTNKTLYKYFKNYSKSLGLRHIASLTCMKANLKRINMLKASEYDLNLWSLLLNNYYTIIRLFMSPVNFSIYEYFKKSDPINFDNDFS